MSTKRMFIPILLLTGVLLTGCGLFALQPGASPDDEMAAIYTQAAETIQAQLTQQAFDVLAGQLTQQAMTQVAVQTSPTATNTQPAPTPTITPTQMPVVTAAAPTPVPPSATPKPALCDHAQFIRDVSVPDGSAMTPDANYSKTWRLKNIGTCTWTTDYALVFEDGDRMSGKREIYLRHSVRPGEIVDLTVDLTAPNARGRYRGFWMLANASGKRFGIGEQAKSAFWVDIRVLGANQGYGFDFAVNVCTASWRSSAGDLDCPGNTQSRDGSIAVLDAPALENGRNENELTLWLRPEATQGGWISGSYPSYTVKDGDEFVADFGCLADNAGCEVTFVLQAKLDDGKVVNLGEWSEVYDGDITRIRLNLSSLAGSKVKFILKVYNDGKAKKGNAFLLAPSIRQKPAPTPTTSLFDHPAVQAARSRVAQDLGLGVSSVTIRNAQAETWMDTCLGVHIPDQVCAEALVNGYRVILGANNRQYEAHTNGDGTVIFWFEL